MGATNPGLPDAAARLTALIDHDRTLIVEAGAGSGKTALMAGRVAMMLTTGVQPREHRCHHLYGSRGKRAA